MDLLYPKGVVIDERDAIGKKKYDTSANILYRGKLLKKCATDSVFAQKVYDFIKNGEDAGLMFFVNCFLWIHEPRAEVTEKPFVAWDYQEEHILDAYHAVRDEYDFAWDKSREMGVTWDILAVYLYCWLFKGWDFRVGSRKQDYVYKRGDMDALMQKLEYMIQRLPEWMLPKGYVHADHFTSLMLFNPETRNSIVGEATNPEFGTGGRKKSIFFDEFAFWECADMAWQKTADATPSRLAVSTAPQSKTHKFARIMRDQSSSLRRKSIHWRVHPLKDEIWKAKNKPRYTEEEWAKEQEISYETTLIGAVYPLFPKEVDIQLHPYNPNRPLFTFWDYGEGGRDDTAIIWMQVEPSNKNLYMVAAYKKNYQDIQFFAPFITGVIQSGKYTYTDTELRMIEKHRAWRGSINIGDPYNGDSMNAAGATIKQLLEQVGVYMHHKRSSTIQDRIRKAASTFRILHVNDEIDAGCQDVVNSLTEARYPSRSTESESTASVNKPVHDWTSHFRTAYEYGIDLYEQLLPNTEDVGVYDPYIEQYQTPYRLHGEPIR